MTGHVCVGKLRAHRCVSSEEIVTDQDFRWASSAALPAPSDDASSLSARNLPNWLPTEFRNWIFKHYRLCFSFIFIETPLIKCLTACTI